MSEGWYTRVISPSHSFGIITGHFPDQNPKHSSAYTAILVNHDEQRGQLQAYESYLPPGSSPALMVERGDAQDDQHTDFEFQQPGGIISIQGKGSDLLYEAHVVGASARFTSLSDSTPWSDGGGGSPQGLLHLLPGLGLHWYVHSTLTHVAYDITLPEGQGRLTGEGWAHVEKNWGGSFPRSFIWSQGFASAPPTATADSLKALNGNGNGGGHDNHGSNGHSGNQAGNGKVDGHSRNSRSAVGAPSSSCNEPQASFCLAGGVLPTLNMDKLPVPLPDTLLLGYRSKALNWHFRPHSPTLFSNSISPEEGLITIKAQQLTRSIVLRVRAPLDSFTRVGGPTRAGFVPHSVESYSATATAECYEGGELVEVTHFDRSALEFGGTYACRAEEGAGRTTDGLVCEPQRED